MEEIVLGIDLGTTFSAAAYVDENGNPTIIPAADGKLTTPSVVLIDNGRIAVGELAMNQWVTNQDHVVRWIKRAMGDGDYRFQGLSAVEISAEILKALKFDAQTSLGVPIDEAVITCPAYFAALEIENTKRAGEAAGFKVKEIVKEPTAAAVHYGVEHMRDGETILVCDLGGGTYDATVLSYRKGIFEPRASKGDRKLGGHEWTMDLVELVAERVESQFQDDPRHDEIASQMLYEACEQAKRDFARVTEVAIPCRVRGEIQQLTVTRDEFEAKTEWRIAPLVGWSEAAVKKAGLSWNQIDKILLVGGSSRLRRMKLALQTASGKVPVQVREADLAVAYGAAILARGKVRSRRQRGGLVDVAGGGLVEVVAKRTLVRNLGTRIIVFTNDRAHITNSLVIPHGTDLPASRSVDEFAVTSAGQEVFDVPVVEYEDDDDFEVVDNFRFKCAKDARAGDRIVVSFDYDVSGIPAVTARVQRTGQSLSFDRLPYKDPDLEEVMRVRVKPRWVVIAIDTSGSMSEDKKMESAREAVAKNAKILLGTGDGHSKVGIVSFNNVVQVVCEPTAKCSEIEQAVGEMVAQGTTDMGAGIRTAVHLVMNAPAGTDRDVVIVTDGMPDDKQATIDAANWAKQRGVTLSTLGIGSKGVDLDFLKTLTPLSLVIDSVAGGGLGSAMATLLTRSAVSRGALVDGAQGDLEEST